MERRAVFFTSCLLLFVCQGKFCQSKSAKKGPLHGCTMHKCHPPVLSRRIGFLSLGMHIIPLLSQLLKCRSSLKLALLDQMMIKVLPRNLFLSTKCSRNILSQFFKQKIQYSGLLLQAQIIIYMHRLSPMKLIANGDSADKNSAKEFDVCSVDHC